ncbi:uncharacterized protein A1O9_00077 [Exophiala aquamarina CBS 119918]|uniref:Proline dehydrogenase n=1 Tax=Exophiala aquamarina CBS 119918 TaxID=1182545 RepID=A0A072Q2H5_9EURO|nr:uncharacterized protein A1O9_00077 [Exophiala aquamarina CBS 119918]KEF62105.1 hypothetical protein A1O9_00077 [Exophiala aquamarina CBS 119918]
MPVADLLRSLLVLSVAALPRPLLLALIQMAKDRASLLSRSRLLSWMIRNTFYKHFCIGSNMSEIISNTAAIRKRSVDGVILTYAKEAAVRQTSTQAVTLTRTDQDLNNWVQSNLQTIEMLFPGDYVALRVTGAGPASVDFLKRYTSACTWESGSPASTNEMETNLKQEHQILQDAMRQICTKAQSRRVRILVDAEGSRYQRAIDEISLNLMAEFNQHSNSSRNENGRATILNTYQLYLKNNIDKIKRHLQHSVDHNYTLGLKLVRGAYMSVEPDREIIHDSKQNTDEAYDAAVKFLLDDRANGLEEGSTHAEKWTTDIMLATHNTRSVQEALKQYMSITKFKDRVQGLAFAQLMGMADELSLSLAAHLGQITTETTLDYGQDSILTTHAHQNLTFARVRDPKAPVSNYPELSVYKYTVWGTLSDCLLYMLRRAEENSDAVTRSRGTLMAVLKELLKRPMLL